MDKKKDTLWKITVAILACIVFVTALFIINNITEKDTTTSTQQSTKATEAVTKDMLDNGMSYLDKDKYKLLCEEMDYNHVMFTSEDLTDKYAKIEIKLTDRYTLSQQDMKNESISKVVNAYNLQAGFFTGNVKKSNGEYGKEKIFIYFSNDFDLKSGNYKAGDKITAYGLIVNCKNNGTGKYNDVSFIPRFIEK